MSRTSNFRFFQIMQGKSKDLLLNFDYLISPQNVDNETLAISSQYIINTLFYKIVIYTLQIGKKNIDHFSQSVLVKYTPSNVRHQINKQYNCISK